MAIQIELQNKAREMPTGISFRGFLPSTALTRRCPLGRVASGVPEALDMDEAGTCKAPDVDFGADRSVRTSPRWNNPKASASRAHRLHHEQCVRVCPTLASSGSAVSIRHEVREAVARRDFQGQFYPS